MHKLFQVVVVFFLFVPAVAAKELIPMGETVEIDLEMPYYVVMHDVYLDSGQWLKKSDEITEVDGQQIKQLEQLPIQDAVLTVNRQGSEQVIQVNEQEMISLPQFVKNTTTGVGTLTYLDPDTKDFGALGHQIIDQALDLPPSVYKGFMYLAGVEKIKKSEAGIPGYKVSQNRQAVAVGEVLSNEVYGIFGKWQKPLQQSLPPTQEIIHAKQIKIGPALLRTSIIGQQVEDFTIQIIEVKGETFQFTVDDQRLIEATGGIVQGMSGSPILQGNQFIGAVTHMFVEQPEKGAAISIVEMIKKSPN